MPKRFANKIYMIDPVWQVQFTLLGAVVLQFLLPDAYLAGPRHTIAVVSLFALLGLSLTTPRRDVFESVGRRINVLVLAASVGLTNLYSLLRVIDTMLKGGVYNGHDLILTALNIYITNIVVFAFIYWEMDGGGPGKRKLTTIAERDFLFPQDNLHQPIQHPWIPTFIDYLYVSSTNATAFSPTDTMPMTRRIKLLMLGQSLVALLTIALIAGRAVNILK